MNFRAEARSSSSSRYDRTNRSTRGHPHRNGGLRDRFPQYWSGVVQGRLFPVVREEIGPLGESHQRVMTTLDVVRIEEGVPSYQGFVGRPQKDRGTLARAFVARLAATPPPSPGVISRKCVTEGPCVLIASRGRRPPSAGTASIKRPEHRRLGGERYAGSF